MSRRYQERVEVRTGPAAEHGVRVEGALSMVVAAGTQQGSDAGRGAQGSCGAGAGSGQGARSDGGGRAEPAVEQDLAEVPTCFLWRGRVHLVRAVLGQWSQRVPWWRAEEPGEERLERRVWRVEAGAGRSMGTGVYDLVQDDRWWLTRVSD